MRTKTQMIALPLAGAILALAASAAYDSLLTPQPLAQPPDEEPARLSEPASSFPFADERGSIADVAERVVESVVNISSERVVTQDGAAAFGPFSQDPFFRHFFRDRFPHVPRERREASLGSGVIVDERGIVLTNNHVIANAERVKVTVADGTELDAEIVGTDPPTDLAVLRIQSDAADLRPLQFGDSDEIRLGEVVLAVGNPFGIGKTVTMGIVSAKGRANVGLTDYEDFIQTDAAINPGNSGGALVDRQGRLIGINTAIVSRSGGYQGIGFAIPSNMAELVMNALLEDGKVVRGWLGVSIQEITPDLGSALDLAGHEGVLVGDVTEDGPADRGGLERGDVVLRFDGQPVNTPSRLRNLVAVAGAHEEVEIDLLRNGKERTVKVVLGELDSEHGSATFDEGDGALGGLTVAPLDDAQRRAHGIPDGIPAGVVVTEIARGSAGARAGFRPGDVILEVNRTRVESVGELRRQYERARGSVAILVQRGRSTLFLAFRKP